MSYCLIHIVLPGTTASVPAGRYSVDSDGSGHFAYERSYLERADAVEIDPVHLTSPDDQKRNHQGDGSLFPALRDGLPDRWGRQLIEILAGPVSDEIGYMRNSSCDRAGALDFVFSRGARLSQPANIGIDELPAAIDAVSLLLSTNGPAHFSGKQLSDIRRLMTSMGGARPKATVQYQDALWVGKFSRSEDRFDVPKAEHAMLQLAREVGLDVAESKIEMVGNRSVLLVKRFDREHAGDGYFRHRMISALTALDASESATHRSRWSYPILADTVTRFVTDDRGAKRELFSRMVFNALISNTDDHPRNHAFIADARGWRLSPAYDLLPHPQVSQFDRKLAMDIGSEGRIATAGNLESQSHRFGIGAEEARNIIAETRSHVSASWYPQCKAAGLNEADCELLSTAFDFEGFNM